MKNKRFMQAMGEIDDSLLMRYERIEKRMAAPKPNRSHIIRWASLAACLCIVFTSVFLLQRERGFGGDTPAIVGSNSETYTQAGTIGGVNERPTQAGTTSGYIADELTKPHPIFETKSADEYESFAQSKELPFTLFPISAFECFGEFSFFETYNLTSFSNFSATYRYQFDQLSTRIKINSRGSYSDYLKYFGDICIEDEDMPENLYINPRTHWLRISENELVEAAYYQKYNISSDDKCIHFKVNDNIVLRYLKSYDNPTVIFWYGDYVIELSFESGDGMDNGYDLICSNTIIKSLLTKSTAPQAAEELYNLWKDALK